MKRILALSLVFSFAASVFIVPSAKADPHYYQYKKLVHDRVLRARGLRPENSIELASSSSSFDQVLDHFAAPGSANAQTTFKQRYFVDSSEATDENSPVIYYLCGEAACDGASNTEFVNLLAQTYHAHRVALEHRYYGNSQPFSDLSTDHLKYLSMDQAIEDLASFQKSISAQLGLHGQWVVVGGSYAGELAAYYRLKHPELAVGAIASSAPVLAKADFFEYDRHVAKVVPAACLSAIQGVVKDVEAKLQDPSSARTVKALFGASMLTSNVDFLFVIADMGALAIQYGYSDKFCQALLSSSGLRKPTEAYARFGNQIFSDFQTSALQDTFQGVSDTSLTDAIGRSGSRAWTYQTCTEFGYFQIANPDAIHSARSQQITLDYNNDGCKRAFGITVPVDAAKTNQAYFNQLSSPSVTHIFFTNGADDPWSNLSLTSASSTAAANPNLAYFTIANAAHCDDLGGTNTPELDSARNQSVAFVGQWLSH